VSERQRVKMQDLFDYCRESVRRQDQQTNTEDRASKKATMQDLYRLIRCDPVVAHYHNLFLQGAFSSFEEFLLNLAVALHAGKQDLFNKLVTLHERSTFQGVMTTTKQMSMEEILNSRIQKLESRNEKLMKIAKDLAAHLSAILIEGRKSPEAVTASLKEIRNLDRLEEEILKEEGGQSNEQSAT